MRHPVVMSLAALCFLLLLIGNDAPLLAQAQVPPGTPEEDTPKYERRYKLPTQPSEEIQALNSAKRQRDESEEARFGAWLEAGDLANKKPPLTVPLSVDGISHARVRRASGLGGGSYVSCTEAHTGLSGNLAASDIASAIVSGLGNVCDAVNNVANNVSEFRSEYDLFLSLKKPLMGVSTLRWHAATLDDAMTIIRSVQEGRVEAAIVRTHQPKKKPEPGSKPIKYELEPCQECLVKEWVFRVSGKK